MKSVLMNASDIHPSANLVSASNATETIGVSGDFNKTNNDLSSRLSMLNFFGSGCAADCAVRAWTISLFLNWRI